ncbi:peroxiredoxin [Pseudenhygromyxa sp. WMMC2535]|uniref:peroxiredoxin n=1 Tax=Pseudenhygromyxa sp. WMMC2535 TaxID=2712867 RepID=UPI001552F5EC|nr:peroxiredoxin [Pseudenhygromyxa sp. WMMC2535]NVB37832.1 peroxiredoxin [Pseudenhygromyxa sp. WMMC2535]
MPRPPRASLVLLSLLTFGLPVAATGLLGCGETQRPDGGEGLLAKGDLAPALSATAHDGTAIDLRALGKPTVIYFYPRDNTPGCTTEACAFRDVWAKYQAAGVLVVGVSTDDDASHRAFAEEHELPFPLIADTDESWAKAFGVPVKAGYTKRVSFLLDAEGKIIEVYPDVDPGVHAEEVLAAAAG